MLHAFSVYRLGDARRIGKPHDPTRETLDSPPQPGRFRKQILLLRADSSPKSLMTSVIAPLIRGLTTAAAHLLRWREPEDSLIRDAQSYWCDPSQGSFRLNAHIRGAGGLPEAAFDSIGRFHLDLFQQFNRMLGLPLPMNRVLEWGCGGGANAVAFAAICDEFVGVDVSQDALDRCEAALREGAARPMRAVRVDIADPEAAVEALPGTCDLFLCTYVFELIPSPGYGRRLLEIARGCLRPGGAALVQIKYSTGHWKTLPRRWSYRRNLANMTTYRIDEFWELATEIGLPPVAVHLRPREPLVNDGRYAYFFLERSV